MGVLIVAAVLLLLKGTDAANNNELSGHAPKPWLLDHSLFDLNIDNNSKSNRNFLSHEPPYKEDDLFHAEGVSALEGTLEFIPEGETAEDIQNDESLRTIQAFELDYEVYVRKCCAKDEAFIQSLNSCSKFEGDFTVPGYITRHNLYVNITEDQMHIQEGLLTACAPSILEREEFVLFDSSELFSTDLNEYFHPDHYCLETIVDDSEDPPLARLTAAYCPSSNFPQTFDPSKVPVRKCCPPGELVSSATSECISRSEVTTTEWAVLAEHLGHISSVSTNFTDIYEIVVGYPECVTKERGESLDESWNFQVLEVDGYLEIPSLGITSPSYCIDEYVTEDNVTSPFSYVCLSDSDYRKYTQVSPSCHPESEYCVEKCCAVGKVLNQNGRCVQDPVYDGLHQPISIYFLNGSTKQISNIDYNFGSPNCGSRNLFVTKEEERAEILANGHLRYISYDSNECDPEVVQMVPPIDYCYDMVLFEKEESQSNTPKMLPGALICYPKDLGSFSRQETQVNYIYSIFLTISDIFILISFVIYLTVPDQTKRGLNKNIKLGHSILGRILLSFLFSLFFAYLCLIIIKTGSDPINVASNEACISLGVVMYIAFLATFFWLNVLCFELWWKCARQERTSGRRWLWYQIYAWGNPLLLGSLVLYIEFSPSIGSCFVKPNFGIQSCFFSETRTFGASAKWIYLNGPVSILLVTDLIFFLLTVKSLLQTVQQSHKGTVKRQARQRLKLCFKLFLVMGICWFTEIVSAATSTQHWYITEVFNCLQGFVIFLIFILKPKIMEAVRERICVLCCGQQISATPLRGTLTFTASVLSDFLNSTKRNNPRLSPFSTSSFSTASSNLSWTSSSSSSMHYPSPTDSPSVPQRGSRPNPFAITKDMDRPSSIKCSKETLKY